MLGPEQVNLGPRAIPQTFASLPSLQISNDAYRSLALSASQVVTGVIALEQGRLYLRANSGGEPIRLPLQYLRWLGREVQFQGSAISSQIVSLTPFRSTLSSASSNSDLSVSEILRHLTTVGGAGVKSSQSPKTALLNVMNFSPAAFLQSPASYIYQLFHINGYQLGHSQKGTDVASSTLLGELLKMLRKQGDPAQRTMIVELVEELRARFVKAESAQRQDLFYAELLAFLDEVPVELSFFRDGNEEPNEQIFWTVNLSVSFDRSTEVCIQIRLDGRLELFIDFWLPNKEMYELASKTQNLLVTEMRGYGLDKVQVNLIDDSAQGEGLKRDKKLLDVSI